LAGAAQRISYVIAERFEKNRTGFLRDKIAMSLYSVGQTASPKDFHLDNPVLRLTACTGLSVLNTFGVCFYPFSTCNNSASKKDLAQFCENIVKSNLFYIFARMLKK
jgi:hypothetical protein